MSDLRKSLEQFRAAYVESSKNGLNIISMATGKISNILCLTNRDILFHRTPYQDCLIS